MTNPCLHDMVKIGYASDVEARRKQLSTTALPFEYAHCSDSSGRKQRPAINFQKCGIPVGAELVFIDDDSVRVTVMDAEKNKVEYNDETTSLSPLAEKLRNVSAIQGAFVFTYNGEKITDIAEETQWKEE